MPVIERQDFINTVNAHLVITSKAVLSAIQLDLKLSLNQIEDHKSLTVSKIENIVKLLSMYKDTTTDKFKCMLINSGIKIMKSEQEFVKSCCELKKTLLMLPPSDKDRYILSYYRMVDRVKSYDTKIGLRETISSHDKAFLLTLMKSLNIELRR